MLLDFENAWEADYLNSAGDCGGRLASAKYSRRSTRGGSAVLMASRLDGLDLQTHHADVHRAEFVGRMMLDVT
jgi:hypothetical protein